MGFFVGPECFEAIELYVFICDDVYCDDILNEQRSVFMGSRPVNKNLFLEFPK